MLTFMLAFFYTKGMEFNMNNDIKNCRLYDLRRSYATAILKNGVGIRDVADVLEHKDIEITENYYISGTD
jgi:site-specific recombinase XerD